MNHELTGGTQRALRLNERGKCEVCGTETNWVIFRYNADGENKGQHMFWCGCEQRKAWKRLRLNFTFDDHQPSWRAHRIGSAEARFTNNGNGSVSITIVERNHFTSNRKGSSKQTSVDLDIAMVDRLRAFLAEIEHMEHTA